MNANARKVHRIMVGFGVACAVAAALPCVAEDAPAVVEKVTVEARSIPPATAPMGPPATAPMASPLIKPMFSSAGADFDGFLA